MPDEIFIQNGKILNTPPKKVRDLHVDEEILKKLNYNNSVAMDNFGNPIMFENKMRDLDSKQYKRNKISRMKKKQKIINMSKDNLEYKLIYSYIRFKGYTGNEHTLERHIYLINKNDFPEYHPK